MIDLTTITDETELKQIRDMADKRLEEIREAKQIEQKEILEEKYRGKYLVFYGRTVSMTNTIKNPNDIKIVHILDIKYRGEGFFKANAKVVHIKYNDEWQQIKHLTSDWTSAYISSSEDNAFNIRECDIDEIIDKQKADRMIKQIKNSQIRILDNWDF